MVLNDGIDYLVDEIDDEELTFFAPEQELFLASAVTVQLEETFSETAFFIQNKLANNVMPGAIIHITIPKQIEIKSKADVESSCTNESNLNPLLKCELVAKDDLSHELIVKDAFGSGGLPREMDFSLKIGKGLITPISKETSDTFKVIITDAEGHEINYVDNSLSLTMAVGKDIFPIDLKVDSDRVGDKTAH